MTTDIEFLHELPPTELQLGADSPDGCCELWSLSTCPGCTFTCNASIF